MKVLSLLFSLIYMSSCVTVATNTDKERIAADIERAKKLGAYNCAPRELALAESELLFLKKDTASINYAHAEKHLFNAQKYTTLALEKSQNCPMELIPSMRSKDKDKDGIIDARDACIDEAEDFDNFKDFDGCPEEDNDEDGINDKDDQCPNIPEDIDQFEDKDGCPDLDNDKDGIPDHEDSCPDTKGSSDKDGCPVHDRDGDLIEDLQDKCPEFAEDFNGIEDKDGCPESDIDGDRIKDYQDKCPQLAEDLDQFEDEDGCPDLDNDQDGVPDINDLCPMLAGKSQTDGCPDNDLDGIADKDDRCPNEAGKVQIGKWIQMNGCPLKDSDLDGIWDYEDKCPNKLGIARLDKPKEHGCPKKYKKIHVTADRIEIDEKIHFSSGKSRILKDSFALLAEIADAIKSADLKYVNIQGHTDSRGKNNFNLRLSQKRATAVMRYLIKEENVAARLLSAKGFGEEKPIESNKSRAGRSMNRRVEFHIERNTIKKD